MSTSPRLAQRRARLRAEYGFDFPDDLYRFWDFANRLAPLDPLNAFNELGVTLVGPFDILAGRFDNRVPKHSLLLHWRYHDDPPEFFTVLYGSGGQYWGCFLDDPDGDAEGGCVASSFTGESEVSDDGDSLFEALRLHVEYLQDDAETSLDEAGKEDNEHQVETLARWRERLAPYLTEERPETGEDYVASYGGYSERGGRVVAETVEGMGIVVPAGLHRPLSKCEDKLWRRLRKSKDPIEFVEEARQALREGFPGTALALGRDLWGWPDRRGEYAAELLDAAYAALDRPTLRRVLQTHLANRNLPYVDILYNEEEATS